MATTSDAGDRGPRPAREIALATVVLVSIALVVLGGYVRDGGFLTDDWTNRAIAQFADGPFDAVGDYRDPSVPSANHVGLAVAFTAQFGILGDHMAAHLLALLGTAVLLALAFFVVLRALGVPVAAALTGGVLVLLFPAADSTRLWATLAANNVAVALWLFGAAATFRALRGGRAAWHVLALALYAASVLLYELTAAPIVLSAALYVLVTTDRRAVARRWAADVVVVALCLWAFLAVTPRRTSGSLGDAMAHGWEIVTQVPGLLADALWPFGGLPGVVAVVVVATAAGVAGRLRRRGVLLALGLGLLGLVAGYVMFVPAERFYVPEYPNQGNRVNLIASFGYVALVGGVAWLVASFGRRAAIASAVAVAAIAVGYAFETREDSRRWADAHGRAASALAAIKATVPKPPPNVTLYLFGQPGRVAEGIPVFDWRFDLAGAVKTLWDDPTLRGYPILTGTRIVCDAEGLHPQGNGLDVNHAAPYGFALFVDVAARRRVGIDSRAECERERRRWRPAPLYVPAS